jgi:type IV pilus assembly protein PilE
MFKRRSSAGFTLIELLIAVLIVGILVRIAYPYYLGTVLKSGRADAKSALNEVSQRMQRCFTTSSTYNPASANICKVFDTVTSSAGFVSDQKYYVVTRAQTADMTATKFLLTATPDSAKRQAKDLTCAKFTLDQAGTRTAYDYPGGNDTTAQCW